MIVDQRSCFFWLQSEVFVIASGTRIAILDLNWDEMEFAVLTPRIIWDICTAINLSHVELGEYSWKASMGCLVPSAHVYHFILQGYLCHAVGNLHNILCKLQNYIIGSLLL